MHFFLAYSLAIQLESTVLTFRTCPWKNIPAVGIEKQGRREVK